MVENNKYDLSDLVVSALEQKPLDFEVAFNDLIIDRIRTAVEDKKIAVAKNMYGYEVPEKDDAETEEEDSNIEDTENAEESE
jgi:hypothetical protein